MKKSPVEKRIGGEVYRYVPILASESLRLRIKLLKLLGSALDRLPEILRGASPGASQKDIDAMNEGVVKALGDIFAKVDPDSGTELIRQIVEIAQVKRPAGYDQVQMDLDFTDRPDELLPVVGFVLKEVFGNFSQGVQGTGLQNLRVMTGT